VHVFLIRLALKKGLNKNFFKKAGVTTFVMLGASPRVPHPRLPFLFFFAKTEKTFSNSSHPRLPFMPSSEKEPPLAYICALISAAHPSISEEVEGHKNNFVCLRFLM